MFGADGRQPSHTHAVVRAEGRSEIASAIDGDFMSQAGELATRLLIVGLDAAVFRDEAAPSDEGNAHVAAWLQRFRWGRKGEECSGGREPRSGDHWPSPGI